MLTSKIKSNSTPLITTTPKQNCFSLSTRDQSRKILCNVQTVLIKRKNAVNNKPWILTKLNKRVTLPKKFNGIHITE